MKRFSLSRLSRSLMASGMSSCPLNGHSVISANIGFHLRACSLSHLEK